MAADGRRRTTIALVTALVVLVAGLISLFVVPQHHTRPEHAPPRASTPVSHPQPSTTVAVSGTPPPTTPVPVTATPQAGAGVGPPPSSRSDTEETPPPPTTAAAPPTEGTVRSPAAAVVACHPDLALEESPDAPYNFLCTRGTTPISWPNDAIRLYTSSLSPPQTAALEIALAQWEADARFTVTRVDSAAAANVVMTNAVLDSNEDGYTRMHYLCTTTCAYDHADVTLASTAELTKTSWVSTILHELGHVAGLNHVARHSEVMYPEIDAQSPAVFGSGDLAGLQELQKVRTAT